MRNPAKIIRGRSGFRNRRVRVRRNRGERGDGPLSTGFVDDEFASALFGSVKSGDCGVRFGGVRHLDESESSGSAGFAVDGEACACDVPVRFKHASEFIFRHCVRHVSDVNLHFSLFRVMDPVCPSEYRLFAFLCHVFIIAGDRRNMTVRPDCYKNRRSCTVFLRIV